LRVCFSEPGHEWGYLRRHKRKRSCATPQGLSRVSKENEGRGQGGTCFYKALRRIQQRAVWLLQAI
jgi:hypothetical protein